MLPPFALIRQHFGFVPRAFDAQSTHPELLESEARLATHLYSPATALTRVQKDMLGLVVAARSGNVYWATLYRQTLLLLGVAEEQLEQIIHDHRDADLSPAGKGLLDFGAQLSTSVISNLGISRLIECGWSDRALIEAATLAAWTKFLCTLSLGLGATPDFEPVKIPLARQYSAPEQRNGQPSPATASSQPRRGAPAAPDASALARLQEFFGFIPAVFEEQLLWQHLISAETDLIAAVLFREGALSSTQKQLIALVSLLALDTSHPGDSFWSDVFFGRLHASGLPPSRFESIVQGDWSSVLTGPDSILLKFAVKLAGQPLDFGTPEISAVRQENIPDGQIVEAAATVALCDFLHRLQASLGRRDDLPAHFPRFGGAKRLHFFRPDSHPTTQESPSTDPDLECVLRIQAGDVNAFEELLLRHHRRVYRILMGLLGNAEEAQDAMQETFLKAFQHLGNFERRAKFSTWLTSIATNTGLQIVRERRFEQSIDESAFTFDDERPRELRAWTSLDEPQPAGFQSAPFARAPDVA